MPSNPNIKLTKIHTKSPQSKILKRKLFFKKSENPHFQENGFSTSLGSLERPIRSNSSPNKSNKTLKLKRLSVRIKRLRWKEVMQKSFWKKHNILRACVSRLCRQLLNYEIKFQKNPVLVKSPSYLKTNVKSLPLNNSKNESLLKRPMENKEKENEPSVCISEPPKKKIKQENESASDFVGFEENQISAVSEGKFNSADKLICGNIPALESPTSKKANAISIVTKTGVHAIVTKTIVLPKSKSFLTLSMKDNSDCENNISYSSKKEVKVTNLNIENQIHTTSNAEIIEAHQSSTESNELGETNNFFSEEGKHTTNPVTSICIDIKKEGKHNEVGGVSQVEKKDSQFKVDEDVNGVNPLMGDCIIENPISTDDKKGDLVMINDEAEDHLKDDVLQKNPLSVECVTLEDDINLEEEQQTVERNMADAPEVTEIITLSPHSNDKEEIIEHVDSSGSESDSSSSKSDILEINTQDDEVDQCFDPSSFLACQIGIESDTPEQEDPLPVTRSLHFQLNCRVEVQMKLLEAADITNIFCYNNKISGICGYNLRHEINRMKQERSNRQAAQNKDSKRVVSPTHEDDEVKIIEPVTEVPAVAPPICEEPERPPSPVVIQDPFTHSLFAPIIKRDRRGKKFKVAKAIPIKTNTYSSENFFSKKPPGNIYSYQRLPSHHVPNIRAAEPQRFTKLVPYQRIGNPSLLVNSAPPTQGSVMAPVRTTLYTNIPLQNTSQSQVVFNQNSNMIYRTTWNPQSKFQTAPPEYGSSNQMGQSVLSSNGVSTTAPPPNINCTSFQPGDIIRTSINSNPAQNIYYPPVTSTIVGPVLPTGRNLIFVPHNNNPENLQPQGNPPMYQPNNSNIHMILNPVVPQQHLQNVRPPPLKFGGNVERPVYAMSFVPGSQPPQLKKMNYGSMNSVDSSQCSEDVSILAASDDSNITPQLQNPQISQWLQQLNKERTSCGSAAPLNFAIFALMRPIMEYLKIFISIGFPKQDTFILNTAFQILSGRKACCLPHALEIIRKFNILEKLAVRKTKLVSDVDFTELPVPALPYAMGPFILLPTYDMFILKRFVFALDKETKDLLYPLPPFCIPRENDLIDKITLVVLICPKRGLGPGLVVFPHSILNRDLRMSLESDNSVGRDWVISAHQRGGLTQSMVLEYLDEACSNWLLQNEAHKKECHLAVDWWWCLEREQLNPIFKKFIIFKLQELYPAYKDPLDLCLGLAMERLWGTLVRKWVAIHGSLKERHFPKFIIQILRELCSCYRVEAWCKSSGLYPLDVEKARNFVQSTDFAF